MTSPDVSSAGAAEHAGAPALSPALSVVLDADGLFVPRLIPPTPWEVGPTLRHVLDLDGLRELARMARAGGLPEPDGPPPLAETLDVFGLWRTEPPQARPRARPTGGRPAVVDAAELPDDQDLMVPSPSSFVVSAEGRFQAHDHDGALVADLTATELWRIRSFGAPSTLASVRGHAAPDGDGRALDELVRDLASTGFLRRADPSIDRVANSEQQEMIRAIRADQAMREHSRQVNSAHDEIVRARAEEEGHHPARIVAVQVAGNIPPLSTGMVLAHAFEHLAPDLAEAYDMHPRWITDVDDITVDGVTTIYLFTSYIWSHERNLDFAAQIKQRQPDALTVFGGPDCPAGEADTVRYLRGNPQVDVAVRGEGEVTFTEMLAALAPSMRAGSPELTDLASVPGVAYRRGDEIVRTADRERMTDLNVVPSPYLTGVFDVFGHTRQIGMAIIETNRGCPYGCTFCDWGSSTRARIRQLDLDRVFAELEWCAVNAVPKIFMADANFGIFARDVDIARRFTELKAQYGYPKRFITNYAKNTVKHLTEIVKIMAEGEVISEGLLSLQSMDETTLDTIRRSNIKLDKYEALAREFHTERMPLFVDLMMGLPGQTVESLRADFQQCVDREVTAKCHATELLVNSPMNQPAYREEHQIEVTRPAGPTGVGAEKAARIGPAFVVATSSFTRDDYNEMHRMRRSYLLSENFGVLRQVTRFVRRETGRGEVDLVEQARRLATDAPDSWPMLATVLLGTPDHMVPPVSWRWFIDEVRRFLLEETEVRAGTDLDTVLTVQHAVLPAAGRTFPYRVSLDHDYPAWWRTVQEVKVDGRLHDWESTVPRLAEFGPAEFEVTDPYQLCEKALGRGTAIAAYLDWELSSPIARAMPTHYRMN